MGLEYLYNTHRLAVQLSHCSLQWWCRCGLSARKQTANENLAANACQDLYTQSALTHPAPFMVAAHLFTGRKAM